MAAHWDDKDWHEKTKHLSFTLKCFRFWGHDVGCIMGDIKEKYGEARWYANIDSIKDLHGIVKSGHYYFRWDPSQGGVYVLLNILNNWSKFLFRFWPIRKATFYWKLFFYNVAYWLPMLKYPGQAYEILHAGDCAELIWFGKKYARWAGIRAGTLDWLLKREAEKKAKGNNDDYE